jgi:hypothetical protein
MAAPGSLDCPNCGAAIHDDGAHAVTSCAFCGTSVAFPKRQRHELEKERATLNEQVSSLEAHVLQARLKGSPIWLRAAGCGCATYIAALIVAFTIANALIRDQPLDAMQQQTAAGSAAVIALIVMLVYAHRRRGIRDAAVAHARQERDAALAPIRKRLAEVETQLADFDEDR